MDTAGFGIFNAARDAYLFMGREWRYLLKAGMMPAALQALLSIFVQFQLKGDVSTLETWLWSFPATLMMAWYSFVQVRLLLLGERADHMKLDRVDLRARQRALTVSVTVSLLFNMMLFVAVTLLLALASSGKWGVDALVTLAGLLVTGFLFWSMRIALLPILAAVDYPMPAFLNRVRGPFFSFRLLGLGIVSLFPVMMVAQIVVAVFFSDVLQDGKIVLSTGEQMGMILFGAGLSLAVTTVLNAAGAYALKQILGGRGVMA